MVTPFNHATAGPDLHRTGPSQFGDFCKIFLPSIGEDQKKSYGLSAGPLAGTAPYYSQLIRQWLMHYFHRKAI